MTCKYCGTNWKKDVTLRELREEIKRRKKLAEDELDAYMRAVWPWQNWTNFLTLLNIICALFGANYFVFLVSVRYEVLNHESAWGMPTLILATGIVILLILSPAVYWSKKESRLTRAFKNKYPEHSEALSGS